MSGYLICLIIAAFFTILICKMGFINFVHKIESLLDLMDMEIRRSWLRKQMYVVPNEELMVKAIESLNICSYISKNPNIIIKEDYFIFELRIRLHDRYASDIEITSEEIEEIFKETCITNAGNCPEVYIKSLNSRKLVAWFSRNLYGDYLIQCERTRADWRNSPPEEDPCMEDLKSDLPVIGFDFEEWKQKYRKKPITVDIRRFPGLLITGASGSGKSVFVTTMLSELVTKFHDEIESIYYLDYKNASESRYLLESGYKHYYCEDNCANGLEEFYERFEEIKKSGKGNDPDQKLNILIFDEAASFFESEQTRGKEGKALAEKHHHMLTSIGLLGRSYKVGLWLIFQQPNADVVKTALRESLHTKVCFLSGGFSPEMKRMIGVTDETADLIKSHDSYSPGTSVVIRQGAPDVICQVPFVKDISVYQKKIEEGLPEA